MLIAAYVFSALLEMVGIGLVVVDVLADRARRIALTEKYLGVSPGTRIRSSSDDVRLSRDPKFMARRLLENERQLNALEANSKRFDEIVEKVLLDLVSVTWSRRLLGPGARRARRRDRRRREHRGERLNLILVVRR